LVDDFPTKPFDSTFLEELQLIVITRKSKGAKSRINKFRILRLTNTNSELRLEVSFKELNFAFITYFWLLIFKQSDMKVIGKDTTYEIKLDLDAKLSLGGEEVTLDMVAESENSFHVIYENIGYDIYIVDKNETTKTYIISVNGNEYTLQAKSKFDELLDQLGMSNLVEAKADNLKAPMPGLVIDILVEPGNTVLKGDSVLVLEAMKMENNIKSPAEGIIKSIDIKKGQAVEKNQVLISFE
tara:strand:- start:249 stop:971 length:723 start_codon:yes stop_codon:yes gene_type:complete